jgi:hypothetical protein
LAAKALCTSPVRVSFTNATGRLGADDANETHYENQRVEATIVSPILVVPVFTARIRPISHHCGYIEYY